MNLIQQIEQTKASLAKVKPRSRRRVQLETRLMILRCQQLKREIRAEKKSAA